MLLSLITVLTLQFADIWNPEDYRNYDFKEFFAREDVKSEIKPETFDRQLMSAAIFYATNEARAKKNRTAFTFAPSLYLAALEHSQDMLSSDFFSHIHPRNKAKKTPMMRIDLQGGDFNATAENIARVGMLELGTGEDYYINEKGQKTDKTGRPLEYHSYLSLARKVVDGWMHSREHRENILGEYTYLGCGVAEIHFQKDGFPELLATQNFGKK